MKLRDTRPQRAPHNLCHCCTGHESYRRILVTEGSGGSLSLRSEDLDSVCELHTLDDLWQLIVATEPAPASLRGFDQLEHHGERGFVGQAALRSDGPVPHRRERALDRVGNRYVIGGRLVDGDSARDVGSSHRDRGARSTEGGQAVDVR
jgi:hypothetical protein